MDVIGRACIYTCLYCLFFRIRQSGKNGGELVPFVARHFLSLFGRFEHRLEHDVLSQFFVRNPLEKGMPAQAINHPSETPGYTGKSVQEDIRLTGQFFWGHPPNRTIGKFGQTYSTCNVKQIRLTGQF